MLEYGRAAERHAKQPREPDGRQEPRNGLAVHLLKRGGGPIEVRANWSKNWWEGMDQQLQTLAQWINDRALSGRVAYDLRKIAEIYTSDAWPAGAVADAIRRDALAVIKGKQPGGKSRMKEVEEFLRERVKDAASLRRFSRGNPRSPRQLAVDAAAGQPGAAQASHQPGELPA